MEVHAARAYVHQAAWLADHPEQGWEARDAAAFLHLYGVNPTLLLKAARFLRPYRLTGRPRLAHRSGVVPFLRFLLRPSR